MSDVDVIRYHASQVGQYPDPLYDILACLHGARVNPYGANETLEHVGEEFGDGEMSELGPGVFGAVAYGIEDYFSLRGVSLFRGPLSAGELGGCVSHVFPKCHGLLRHNSGEVRCRNFSNLLRSAPLHYQEAEQVSVNARRSYEMHLTIGEFGFLRPKDRDDDVVEDRVTEKLESFHAYICR